MYQFHSCLCMCWLPTYKFYIPSLPKTVSPSFWFSLCQAILPRYSELLFCRMAIIVPNIVALTENKCDNVGGYEHLDDNQEHWNWASEAEKEGNYLEEFVCIYLEWEWFQHQTTFTKFSRFTGCESQIQIWKVILCISCGKVSQSINLLSALFPSSQA